MVETIRYSQLMLQDMALGLGQRSVRLADQGVYVLDEIHLTKLLTVQKFVVLCSTFTGQGTMVVTNGLTQDRRIWGVTVKNQVALGATGGLTGYLVGDAAMPDRWSNAAFPLTVPFESDEGDFLDFSLMIYPASATRDIILTGVGGLFDATGQVEVAVHMSVLRHPS